MVPIKEITSRWKASTCLKINPNDPTTMLPVVDYNFPVMDENILLWDTWHLRDPNNYLTTINGWHILFSLVIGIDNREEHTLDKWNNRNNGAYIGSFISRDGISWKFNGRVLNETCDIRRSEWSGSARLDDFHSGKMTLIFTSVDDTEQVPSKVEGRIVTSEDGVKFEGFDKCIEIIHADDINEATYHENPYAANRDGYDFKDPKTGKRIIFHETDLPWNRGQYEVDDRSIGYLPPDSNFVPDKFATGSIGAAVYDGNSSFLKILPPVLSAFGACVQTERPKVLFINDLYYLFTITHGSQFTKGINGADGLYGFVSTNPLGKYAPVNGSGQTVLCRPSQPVAGYSFDIWEDCGRIFVSFFIDRVPDPNDPTKFRIGGTLGRTIELAIDPDNPYNIYVVGELGYGEYPVSRDIKTN